MASTLEGDRFVILTLVTPEEVFTDDYTAYRSLDTDGAGTTSMEPGIFGGQGRIPFFAMSSFPLNASDPTGAGAPSLPDSADPPFPPVYPYFFSTDVVYGREHMNTILRFVRGDSFKFVLDIDIDGSPYNLTGTTMKMTAKWSHSDSDANALFQKTIGDGITYTDAANGQAQIILAPADTISLPPQIVVLQYDVELTDGSSVYTVARGDLAVLPDVTVGT